MRHPDFPSSLAMPAAWQATLQLRFARRGERTALTGRRHQGPLLVQKPLYPEGGICHAVILHPPAGVAGGDSLDIDVTVEDGAHAVLATPGATKWYKSLGRDAAQRVRLAVGAGARLDWLPQENIVFDDARARISTVLDVAPGGSAIGWDAVVLGRLASGEQWARGALWLDTRIGTGERALWIEQAHLEAASPLRTAVGGLDGLNVLGTLWAVGEGATQELAEALAERLPYTPALRAGVTCLSANGQSMLLLRVLGQQMEAVRHVMTDSWQALRLPVHGVAARPLRLWAT
ncbi:urease accessory protein UreD [Cupriavidus taiwanensis]|uniref:urease accessory protein UreD n=1 Tax=Cupriavidus taiwanensis TaxID=164546 RepID=UPI0015729C15|nr:urease accessory protein UreD [Cupriavidus taiwanensis]MDK3024557.1 urease accessory protein UreD [Cupriavidus taiwanensis]NSX18011.1 urease accessory protein UreD [Cupriavidus taiwanensis]